ncbi:MAG: branched-chain amino acid aminotransferase [Candidatus Thorarchaeota archaeon]|nr:branched-chain amino acid aminotransferase [Candidatus Thorarchaeota archaeon]
MDVTLVREDNRKQKPSDPMNLTFGSVYTDHMLTMCYRNGQWLSPEIKPYAPLELSPAALVLHYGQGIFEGMKAYRRGNRVLLFRPRENFKRLNRSAKRMVMPKVDQDFILDALAKLIDIERDWIPREHGTSLYIRPTMIATEPKLGVKPSDEYLFYIILSPVGPYFKEGFSPVSIHVSSRYTRAVRGGVGAAKTMSNYATSLLATKKASEKGYSQVLWLDAIEREYIEECGTMNVFVRFDDELATPPLNDTILPGITRDSVLKLARDWGYHVNERKISIHETIDAIEKGKILEIFGTGTAAVIAPVGELHFENTSYQIANGTVGDLSQRLFDTLTGIQCGEIDDSYGWIYEV